MPINFRKCLKFCLFSLFSIKFVMIEFTEISYYESSLYQKNDYVYKITNYYIFNINLPHLLPLYMKLIVLE